jgi:glyoxylase-like metal-dependent hydrolase (beta-lactamase superfamily II)
MAFLWIPLKGFTSQQQTKAQSLRAFLSMPLGDNEAAFMCLGPYSNIIVRVADKTVLFDPATLDEEELDILNNKGVDLVVYTHGHYDHFSSSTALQLFKGSQPDIAVEASLSPFFKDDIPNEKLITTASGKSFSSGNISWWGFSLCFSSNNGVTSCLCSDRLSFSHL